jgi:hypothetical protein
MQTGAASLASLAELGGGLDIKMTARAQDEGTTVTDPQ